MSAMISALLNAPLLFFVLGALSRMARSDLRIPRALSKTLSIYLLAGIGLHGARNSQAPAWRRCWRLPPRRSLWPA